MPLKDYRFPSQFDREKQGKTTPQSVVMKSFNPGILSMGKNAPYPSKKRFGVIEMDVMALRKNKNKTVQDIKNDIKNEKLQNSAAIREKTQVKQREQQAQ